MLYNLLPSADVSRDFGTSWASDIGSAAPKEKEREGETERKTSTHDNAHVHVCVWRPITTAGCQRRAARLVANHDGLCNLERWHYFPLGEPLLLALTLKIQSGRAGKAGPGPAGLAGWPGRPQCPNGCLWLHLSLGLSPLRHYRSVPKWVCRRLGRRYSATDVCGLVHSMCVCVSTTART